VPARNRDEPPSLTTRTELHGLSAVGATDNFHPA
jgi:hypothetical protein